VERHSDGSPVDTLPVPVSPYGPYFWLARHVHEMCHTGRCEEALVAVEAYTWAIRLGHVGRVWRGSPPAA
jgi:hypothetical protein